MTPSTTNSTDERTDESPDESLDKSTSDWPGVERRPLLKALGIGATLSLGSGATVAASGASEVRDHWDAHSDQIHPIYGYPTTDAEDVPEGIEPAHEVELHRDFPENPQNPEHPSFFHFEPTGLQVEPGDVVQFTYKSPNHTVSPYHPGHGFQRRVPEGVPAFSSPLVQKDGAWLYRFEEAGLYDLFCGVHEVTGMVMRLVVGDLAEEDVPAYEDTFEAEPPLFPPVSAELLETELNALSDQNQNVEWTWLSAPQVLDTDALDPMNIQNRGKVSFEMVADELGAAFEPE